ncbi:vascular endothelial growth factor receptor 2 isoform X2 [Neoarius graeffei]|uniref:vascular endothelial growth factor receptor 2 isoform X2 n=1 Tax=Neoarius graeffei TaxID=443677 RepID=UPI00298C47B2|nr:vascular endothelial growth factor receptor 2 isoform X2 [Neoarius graeffei]
MRLFVLLTAVIFAFSQNTTATLFVKGPTESVLEGERVTLECLDSESEHNMSSVHFEKMSRHMHMWHRLDVYGYGYYYRRCFGYEADVTREDGRLLLSLGRAQTWSAGVYRCVSDNTTDADNSSLLYTLTVHYLREVSVSRTGTNMFSRYLTTQDHLRIPLGDDVELDCSTSASETPQYSWFKEGEDWVVPSSKLKLKQVRLQDSGEYTCRAQHPSVSSLTKKRTISLTVLPEDAAWYESTNAQIYLGVSAIVVVLLVIILSMAIFLCRRASQNKSKGPIDDHSQKKPIYKNSVESLASTAGDKQPLV